MSMDDWRTQVRAAQDQPITDQLPVLDVPPDVPNDLAGATGSVGWSIVPTAAHHRYTDAAGRMWYLLRPTAELPALGALARTVRLLLTPPADNGNTPDHDAADIGWPDGPDGLPPGEVRQLITRLLTDETVTTTAQASQSGLTIGRIKRCGLSEVRARLVLRWFERAGLIAPAEPQQSTPRPLLITAIEEIRIRLVATPPQEPRS